MFWRVRIQGRLIVASQAAVETDVSSCPPVPINDAAQKFKILGHPIRLKLLYLIYRDHDSCVGELHTCLQQPQPVVSQHLAVLKEGGIVQSVIKGNRRIYSIVDPFVYAMLSTLADLPGSTSPPQYCVEESQGNK